MFLTWEFCGNAIHVHEQFEQPFIAFSMLPFISTVIQETPSGKMVPLSFFLQWEHLSWSNEWETFQVKLAAASIFPLQINAINCESNLEE